MTQEDKELLLKDLCARLPYHVKVAIKPSIQNYDLSFNGEFDIETLYIREDGILFTFKYPYHSYFIDNVRPYLRPMSSMTEEEEKIYKEISNHLCGEIVAKHMMVFLNKHHFDYQELIKKGLALEAPEDMYKI